MLFAALAAGLVVSGCAAAPPAKPAGAMADVARVDRLRLSSSASADVATLRTLLADDLSYCHSNAYCESGASLLRRIASGELRYLKLESRELQPEQVGNVVLVHGKVDMQAQNGAQTLAASLSYLAVYERRDGRWQLRAYQSTRIP